MSQALPLNTSSSLPPPSVGNEDYAIAKGYSLWIQGVTRRYYEEVAREDPKLATSNSKVLHMLEYLKKKEVQEDEQGYCSEWVFITVNPKPGTTVKNFQKLVVSAVSKKWIGEYAYAFEWRDQSEGLHVHILLTKPHNKRPAQVHREFTNTFKHVIGNPQHVNVKYLYTPEAVAKRYHYLYGDKAESKMSKVENDWIQRDINCLESIYISGSFEDICQEYCGDLLLPKDMQSTVNKEGN